MATSKAKTEAVNAEVKEGKKVAAAKTEEKVTAKAAEPAVKAEIKKPAAKTAAKKDAAKAETKAEPKKAAAKKTAAKKPAAKKAAAKTTAAKATTRKSVKKPASRMILQFMGKDVNVEDLKERALAQFAALQPDVPVKEIAMYLKPEDSAAYYVINDEHMGKVDY